MKTNDKHLQLDEIRRLLLAMDSLDDITPEMRELIETYWPDLAAKLPPSKLNDTRAN
jgi:hypothetical protein